MKPCLAPLPALPDLTAGLNRALRCGGHTDGPITVIDRQRNPDASTFPSEIINCRLGDGRALTLFCKYASRSVRHRYGHRRGVAYEAEVYRQVLRPLDVSAPGFYGTYTDASTGVTWLLLEYLAGSAHVGKDSDSDTMSRAAEWAGLFHARCRERLARAALPFLITYDADYYRGWACRTQDFAGQWHKRFPWLKPLCEAYSTSVEQELLRPAPTVIHGEFYSANVLFHAGAVCPVDWESAALAPGEIDLAALIERWPEETARKCLQAYRRARWPDGAPAGFDRSLTAAQLYLHFRWMGNRPEWAADERRQWRFAQMHAAGGRLGLI